MLPKLHKARVFADRGRCEEESGSKRAKKIWDKKQKTQGKHVGILCIIVRLKVQEY